MSDRSETKPLPRIFQPSTMASRRAEREARGEVEPRSRWVSMGWRKETVEGLGRDAPMEARWYEMVYDADRPSRVFVRWQRDGELVPIVRHVSEGTRVLESGVMPRRARPSGNFPASGPDVVTRIGDDD